MRFEGALGKLNESYFFREFTFSTNTFRPDKRTELELADAVVWLDDFLVVIQVKERYAAFGATSTDEENWFQSEVLGKAVTQIGNTLRYLRTYDSIELENNQGHALNLADAKDKRTHKLVIYHPNENLPDRCVSQKFHENATTGVIHIIHSADYLGILETLITPAEVEQYLSFREVLIKRWGNVVSEVTEQALVGQFLRNVPEQRPSPRFIEWLAALQQRAVDTQKWDISRIIHLFAERRNTPEESPTDYYGILKELAKLNRTDMDAFKTRFFHSMKMANADNVVLPNRFVASTGCGFVFIPLQRARMGDRHHALAAFTQLNKYDLRLQRCVGLTFVSEGNETWCDVQWHRLDYPWKENPKFAAALKKNYPFRPMKTTVVERYGLSLPEE
ncbi:MAG: hypothetical protein DMG35_19840 [Acidobacteria bacterium]|nr:MAG: hypothetical protein DMG35_19840 [Acidobacteriota bacterium]